MNQKTDYELFNEYFSTNRVNKKQQIELEFLSRYKPLIKSKCYKYAKVVCNDYAYEIDDIYQEICIMIINAIRKIRIEEIQENYQFGMRLNNTIKAYLKAFINNKDREFERNEIERPTNYFTEIECKYRQLVYASQSEEQGLGFILKNLPQNSAEIQYDSKNIDDLYQFFKSNLNTIEKRILNYTEKQSSKTVIAKKLKVSNSYITVHMNLIKNKYLQFMKKEGYFSGGIK